MRALLYREYGCNIGVYRSARLLRILSMRSSFASRTLSWKSVGCGCSWLSIYPCHVCRSPAGTQCRQPVSLVACACLYLQPSRHTSQPRIVSGILHTHTRQSLTLSGLVHDDLFNRIDSSKTRPGVLIHRIVDILSFSLRYSFG